MLVLSDNQKSLLRKHFPEHADNAIAYYQTCPDWMKWMTKALGSIASQAPEPRAGTSSADASGSDRRAVGSAAASEADRQSVEPGRSQQGQAARQQGAQTKREYAPSLHIYGGKASLCIEEGVNANGEPCLFLDAANSTGPRKYDYANKTRIMFTRLELPMIAAVLLGLVPRVEYKNHGAEKNKAFSIERQDNAFFVKVFEGSKPIKPVPVGAADAFYMQSFVLGFLKKQTGMDVTEIKIMLASLPYGGQR